MIATDMNAHAQFKHAMEIESENPATLSRNGVFYPRSYYMSNLFGRTIYAVAAVEAAGAGIVGAAPIGPCPRPPLPPFPPL